MSRIDLGNNITKPKTVPATAKGFIQKAESKKTGQICADLADLYEQLKRGELSRDEYKEAKDAKKLGCSFYTPHAHFNKGYKRGDGDPVDSGKAIVDLDGCEDFKQLYEKNLKGRERELGINMANISVSGTGGHLLFDIPEGLDRQHAQAWMANELGAETYDKGVHERERAVYIPCREYILYIDEELMFSDELHPAKLSEEEIKKWMAVDVTTKKENAQKGGNALVSGPSRMVAPPTGTRPQCVAECQQADERTRLIAEGVMKEKGLQWSHFLNEGGRHTAVKIFLSGATQLLTKAEANGVLAELMPQHWQDDNIQELVTAFYKDYTNPNQRLLKYQEQLFTESQKLIEGGGDKKAASMKVLEGQPQVAPPAMPAKMPKLIELLTSKVEDRYKPTVAHAVFPALATHLCEVSFNYTDNVEHEATLMNCLMAGTGEGKGCIDMPIQHIMADIKRRDKENEKREADWKKECCRRGNNKDNPVRPEGLVIQIIDSDMTKPALVTRLEEADGHFIYVKLNELDLFEQLKGQNGKQHFQLMCLAFDPLSEYGQTRVGTQSVTARPRCRFNWNASSTIQKGRRFFRNVLTDGPISRINFCTIPDSDIGDAQPVFGKYDEAFDEALKPYIDNLVAARGLIDCPQAFKLAKKLQNEVAEFARLSQNVTYWNLSHRACVIAWLKACVIYVANGQKWEKSIEEFIRWSLNYDLWCKMQFFGDAIEKANRGDDARIGTRGPRNLLELLPDEFTLDDAKRVRQQQGLDTANTISMIRNWKNRNYIIQYSEFSFKKNAKFESNGKSRD